MESIAQRLSIVLLIIAAALVASCATDDETASPSTGSPSAAVAPGTAIPSASPPEQVVPSTTPAPATPAPTGEPAETPTPAPTGAPADQRTVTYRAAEDILDAQYTADGKIVLATRDSDIDVVGVVTLDASGRVLPGWPWSSGDDSTFVNVALGPDHSVYAAVRTWAGTAGDFTWQLHRLDVGGAEMAGFPVALPDGSFCQLVSRSDGAVVSTCSIREDEAGRETTTVGVVRPDGSTPAGWPVILHPSAEIVGLGRDDAVALKLVGVSGPARIRVVEANGQLADGWPRRIHRDATVQVDARGRVHVSWTTYRSGACGRPKQTTYAVYRPDGTVISGWPVTLGGWASTPLLADDGTATVLTGSGRAIRYDVRGRVVAGWPVENVPVAVGCAEGNAPVDAGGGAVVVASGRSAVLLEGDGSIARGWPVELPLTAASRCPSCTPGPSAALPPAAGAQAVWVAAYRNSRPQALRIDRRGSRQPISRMAIGKRGDDVWWVRVAPNGRVWALVSRWSDARDAEINLLVPVGEDEPLG